MSLPDQLAVFPEMPERIMFHFGRMITGQTGRGEGHGNINRSICILIADHVQIPEVADYHKRYRQVIKKIVRSREMVYALLSRSLYPSMKKETP